MSSRTSERVLWLVIFGVVAGEFALDMVIRNGLVDWVIYFIPVYLSSKVGGRHFSYLLAGLISLLMLVAFYCSPPGIDPRLALTGRGIGMGTLWLLAVLIARNKGTENELQLTDRALRTISACNQALVHASSESVLLQDICQQIVDKGGYRMTWVGIPEHNEQKSVRIAASAGGDSGYLAKAKITWSDTSEHGRGPTGIAIRTGQVVVVNNFQNDLRTVPWHKEAFKRSLGASISLPLKNAGETFGVLMIYAAQTNAFNRAEMELLTALADDLAFGLHALRGRAERQVAQESLRVNTQRLEFLLANTPAILYSMRATDDFANTFVSANVREVLGHPPETFLKDTRFWLSQVHPDDAPAAVASFHNGLPWRRWCVNTGFVMVTALTAGFMTKRGRRLMPQASLRSLSAIGSTSPSANWQKRRFGSARRYSPASSTRPWTRLSWWTPPRAILLSSTPRRTKVWVTRMKNSPLSVLPPFRPNTLRSKSVRTLRSFINEADTPSKTVTAIVTAHCVTCA